MKGQLLAAAVLSAAMFVQPLTAAAAYQSAEEIKLAVRPMQTAEGMYHPEGSQILYITPSAALSGAQMHVGVFIETERADLNMIVLELETSSDRLTFLPDTFRNPKMDMAAEASTYSLPDGTTFESQYLPYCLGTVTEKGLYKPACYTMLHNFPEDGRSFRVNWQYGFYSDEDVNATAFLGGKSDAFSFVEMDMQLAAGTAPGVYEIAFNATDSVAEDENKSHTIITSYEGTLSKSAYADLVPGLKPLDIIVGAAQLDGDAEVFRYADDTSTPSPADLTSTIRRLQGGTLTTVSPAEACFTYAEAPVFPDAVTVPETAEALLLCDNQRVLTAEGKPAAITYRIGCRGDVDLDGAVTASDAARILIFAAQQGAGEEASLADAENENFAEFLGDVNGNGVSGELNASDAACVLIYAAINGSGRTPDWQEILHPTN